MGCQSLVANMNSVYQIAKLGF